MERLRKILTECTHFDGDVPDSILEIFFEKIWVSKDEFRWYLKTVSKSNQREDERVEIASFIVTQEDAKKYLYEHSPQRRVFNWNDFKVSIWM